MKIFANLATLVTVATMLFYPVSTIAKEAADEGVTKGKGEQKQDSAVNADAHPAPCRSWIDPHVQPQMALLCIHGLGLNSDAFANFGQRMAARGIATYAIDVRGFGSWMKAKGQEQVNFDQCLGDVQATLQALHAANPGLPVFLLGESMGGAIALRACSMYPDLMDGLISSVPSGDRFQQKKTDLKVALEFLKGRNKQFDIGKQIVGQATENYPAVREDWESDPLDRMDLSAEQLIQFQKFMNDNHDAAKKIDKLPVLILQGTLDTLVKPEGTWELFNDLATRKKTFVALPSEHLVLEEGQAKSSKYDARTAALVVGWLHAWEPNENVLSTPDAGAPAAVGGTVPSGALPSTTTVQSDVGPATDGTIFSGAPTVLIFEASWCVECQGLDQLVSQAKQLAGDKVKVAVKSVDVDDPANAQLVKSLGIAPIPTCVFLKSNGTVNSVLIGRSSVDNIAQAMQGISANQ